jgi:hypothetical protein
MICCQGRNIITWLLLLLPLGVALWYLRLPQSRKRFYANLVRQIPELPGRYFA